MCARVYTNRTRGVRKVCTDCTALSEPMVILKLLLTTGHTAGGGCTGLLNVSLVPVATI